MRARSVRDKKSVLRAQSVRDRKNVLRAQSVRDKEIVRPGSKDRIIDICMWKDKPRSKDRAYDLKNQSNETGNKMSI